jgi:hypothetical protein
LWGVPDPRFPPSAALTDLIDCVLGFCGGRNGLLATFADQPSTWCSFEYPDARLSFFTTPIALFFVVRSTAEVHLANYEFFCTSFFPPSRRYNNFYNDFFLILLRSTAYCCLKFIRISWFTNFPLHDTILVSFGCFCAEHATHQHLELVHLGFPMCEFHPSRHYNYYFFFWFFVQSTAHLHLAFCEFLFWVSSCSSFSLPML